MDCARISVLNGFLLVHKAQLQDGTQEQSLLLIIIQSYYTLQERLKRTVKKNYRPLQSGWLQEFSAYYQSSISPHVVSSSVVNLFFH